jgi:hypothetical protein
LKISVVAVKDDAYGVGRKTKLRSNTAVLTAALANDVQALFDMP